METEAVEAKSAVSHAHRLWRRRRSREGTGRCIFACCYRVNQFASSGWEMSVRVVEHIVEHDPRIFQISHQPFPLVRLGHIGFA